MSEKVPTVTSQQPPSKWRLHWELSRLHKFPMGSDLVFWPCAWASTLAAYQTATTVDVLSLHILALAIGSTLLHSAACVINDLCDVEYDRQVERTKSRPLASGKLSVRSAVVLLVALTAGTLLCLSLAGPLAFRLGLFGVFPLHALYPLMKRWTHWPQAWLGLAMNWGIFVAWVPMAEIQSYSTAIILFAGAWAWTIVYDTIYASQDKRDDVKAGVGSMALFFGSRVRPALSFFALVFVASLTYAGVANHQTPLYFAVSVGGAGLHLLWQLATLDFDEPADCAEKFKSNGTLGFIVWSGIFLDYIIDTY
ncbi:4-hydroxybenzoate polyprenyl transferase [Gyrodon lividus]|nr:4-hydroxybenzoate polyprenyl transferase [Gyrodon lividus]